MTRHPPGCRQNAARRACALYTLGQLYLQTDRLAEAVKQLTQAVKIRPAPTGFISLISSIRHYHLPLPPMREYSPTLVV